MLVVPFRIGECLTLILTCFFHPRNFFPTVAAPTIVANVSGRTHVAVDGYDPVSFFDNEPVNGNFQIKSSYEGATYFFKDEANKAKFEANPVKYVPQVCAIENNAVLSCFRKCSCRPN